MRINGMDFEPITTQTPRGGYHGGESEKKRIYIGTDKYGRAQHIVISADLAAIAGFKPEDRVSVFVTPGGAVVLIRKDTDGLYTLRANSSSARHKTEIGQLRIGGQHPAAEVKVKTGVKPTRHSENSRVTYEFTGWAETGSVFASKKEAK